MAGYGGGHPHECPKCGAPPWESCYAADDCLRTGDSDMRGETHSYQPKPPLANNIEDKHGFAPIQFRLGEDFYWRHTGNRKLYEVIGFTYMWTEEWGIKYKALGEEIEHAQPAKRFFGQRDGLPRFERVPAAQALEPDPAAYREYNMNDPNVDSDYAKLYAEYPTEKPYSGLEREGFLQRLANWMKGRPAS